MTENQAKEPDQAVRVEVTAEDSWEAMLTERTAPVLREPDVVRDFPDADHWLVGWDVSEKSEGRPYAAIIQDSVSGRSTMVEGSLDGVEDTSITYLPHQRPPSDDEFAWAVSMVAERETGSTDQPYRPFPPLANVHNEDGTVRRVVAVGLRAADGGHRIVGVESGTGDLVAGPPGVEVAGGEFGAPPADQGPSGPQSGDQGPSGPQSGDQGPSGPQSGDQGPSGPQSGDQGPSGPQSGDQGPSGPGATVGDHQARVRVWRGEDLLWDLVVVRPSASSGMNGSGVELRQVDFVGTRLLERGHLPIVTVTERAGGDREETVDTGSSATAPTDRMWMHEESGFDAPGDGADPAEGFRICSAAPATVLESGVDGGPFRGVALWLDGTDLLVTSQVRAGWHRFVHEWRLSADGTIRLRLGYAPARRPGADRVLVVRSYWRLDADIVGPDDNTVQEYNDPPAFGTAPWHTIRYEMRRSCEPAHQRYWRLRHDRTSRAYSLIPDAAGEAVWVLRHHTSEVDDGLGSADGSGRGLARIDDFLTGEPVHREDIVVWHSAVLRHDPAAAAPGRVGPDLIPRLWKTPSPLVEPALLDAETDPAPQ